MIKKLCVGICMALFVFGCDDSSVDVPTNIDAADPEILATPENLQSSNESATSLTLTWVDRSNSETAFEIDRSLQADFTDAETIVVAADETQFDDSGLTPETQYYYRVRAVNEIIQSDYCAPLAVQTASVPASSPMAPSDLGAKAVSSSQIELTWVDNSDNEDGFTLMWSADGVSFTELLTTEANIRTYIHEKLTSQTTYYYRIQAYNESGASAYAGPVSTTTLAVDSHIPVSSVLTPFDANEHDVVGPSHWSTRYGKTPEIIVSSNGVELDLLAQDYDAETAWSAVLLHITPGAGGGYNITQALTNIPMLDRIMGLATDTSGGRYYATGVNEDDEVDATYPPDNTYRNDIVRVIKLNPGGDVLFNIDLDTARHAHNNDAEMIINPMVAASSRLAVGAGEIALVHGINTGPDGNIRHQKALSTRLDATNGSITRTSSVWVSHSFDQRLLYDGQGIIEHHLGDAYPREIVFARDHTSYPLFHIKGALGENNTHTRLGNIALIENDPTYRYIALFATENSVDTGNAISGPRNLAIVRVNGSDNSIDPSLPDTLTVSSSNKQYTNRLRWLTHYSNSSQLHAERPKLIGIGGGLYVVLWEQWLASGTFNGVHGMVIDDIGNIVQADTLITDSHHLHRGDDAFLLDNRAAWITGNADERKLHIHFVDASLNYEMVTLD